MNPLVDSFHKVLWLRSFIAEILRDKISVPNHFIEGSELSNTLISEESTCTSKTHYIKNKGLDDKLKKFGSNPKTCHINLKTEGI